MWMRDPLGAAALARPSWRKLTNHVRTAVIRWMSRRGVFRLRRVVLRTTLVSTLTLVGCAPSVIVPAATPTTADVVLRLYATTSTEPLARALTSAYRQVAPQVEFELVVGDHEILLAQTVDGVIPAYLLTHHLPAQTGTAPVWGAPVAQDGIVVLASGQNAPASISRDHLRQIYQGWSDNWGDVGGADAPIVVITREDSSALRAEFDADILGSRGVTQAAQIAPAHPAMLLSLARQPDAIGYASFGALNTAAPPEARSLALDGIPPTRDTLISGAYPLRTFIYLAGAGEPTDAYRAFIGWVQSPDGQAVVDQSYLALTPAAR